jgi:thioredoxin 1
LRTEYFIVMMGIQRPKKYFQDRDMGFFGKFFGKTQKPGRPQEINDNDLEEILQSRELVVVDFYSLTCPPCQVMGGLLNELGPAYAGRIDFFKLNVDRNPRAAAKFQIQSVPTVMLFRQGKIVDRIIGLLPLTPLKSKFDQLARRISA